MQEKIALPIEQFNGANQCNNASKSYKKRLVAALFSPQREFNMAMQRGCHTQ